MENVRRRNAGWRFPVAALLVVSLCGVGGGADAKTWTVTNDNDNGHEKTLRYAVDHAVSGDKIEIAIMALVLNSQLTISKNLTISSTKQGFNESTIWQVGKNARVIRVESGVTCSLAGLVVTGGNLPPGYDNVGGGVQNFGTLTMISCRIESNRTSNHGGGIYNRGTLTLSGCAVQNNNAYGSISSGGGICNTRGSTLTLKSGCAVKGNYPDNISGSYASDGTNTIGNSPNQSATVLDGYSGSTAPAPRSIVGDTDVSAVSNDLQNADSVVARAVRDALAADLGDLSGDVSTSLYNAFTYENVHLSDDSGTGELSVAFTASWPERVRYYALFARADGSGYEIPERGVLFEVKPGQVLPEGVTPPSFYVPGEGLMTWRNVVTDGGSFDLDPVSGEVTFRVCSVRTAAATAPERKEGGCDAGGLSSPMALLLLGLPLAALRKRH